MELSDLKDFNAEQFEESLQELIETSKEIAKVSEEMVETSKEMFNKSEELVKERNKTLELLNNMKS